MRKKKPESDKICIEEIVWSSTDIKKSYQTIMEVLANDIQKGIEEEKIKFDCICGIPRGGIIPAVSLSCILGIPYKEFSDEEIYVKNVLFVDNIVRNGKTLATIPLNHSVLNNRLVVVVKNEISFDNKYVWKSGIEVGKNVWTSFPWEEKILIDQAIKHIRKFDKNIDLIEGD